MSTTIDIDYWAQRERQERERAERASDETSRRVHHEMAKRYSALMRENAGLESSIPLRG